MLTHRVYEVLKNVLDADRLEYGPITSFTASRASLEANNAGLTLFEHMTRNNRPEIRAQEAIFPHLIAAGFQVGREKAVDHEGKRRIFDFVVSDTSSEVIVELKHYSPHQTDQFRGLLGPIVTTAGLHRQSLSNDFCKYRPIGATLIQIGLYTAVEGWCDAAGLPVPQTQSGSYFIEKFVARPLPRNTYTAQARDALRNWPHLHLFTCPMHTATDQDYCEGPDSAYTSRTDVTVRGRVNYFLGIASSQDSEIVTRQ